MRFAKARKSTVQQQEQSNNCQCNSSRRSYRLSSSLNCRSKEIFSSLPSFLSDFLASSELLPPGVKLSLEKQARAVKVADRQQQQRWWRFSAGAKITGIEAVAGETPRSPRTFRCLYVYRRDW